MDPFGLVEGALAPLRRVRNALEGMEDVKLDLRQRYADYASIIEPLARKPDVVAAHKIDHELEQLTKSFNRIEELIRGYTAAGSEGKFVKLTIKAKRAAYWEDVKEEHNEIDADVMRQLATMNAKVAIHSSETSSEMKSLLEQVKDLTENGAISSSGISAEMKGLLEQIRARVTDTSLPNLDPIMKLLEEMRPPSLPDMAAVPAGALTLPSTYVDRAGVQEAVGALIGQEMALAPYTVVGMGGGGKTMLASAVVRNPEVRKHFRGGIFWTLVGRGAKNNLLSLLQDLARKVTPHGMSSDFDSAEKVQQHLAASASKSASAGALVVLDDVWEREVVDAFLPLGFKILVTTRDRSVVGVPGGLLELGDMAENEALDVLLKSSKTVGNPGAEARIHMMKVVERCGRLPLLLAIAGSMPVVRGKGLKAGAWENLAQKFENEATKMEASGEGLDSLEVVLVASFSALAARKRDELLKMAVLAPGAIAPIEMLLNLWEMEDTEGTREEADGLVNKCLLQDGGGETYRVHDIILAFAKIKISSKAHKDTLEKATVLQAQYLGRLDVLQSYKSLGIGAGEQGLYNLDTLWRSVEELSGNAGLEVASYAASLAELDLCEATEEVAISLWGVASLYMLQDKRAEVGPLLERCQTILENVQGPENRSLAVILNNRACFLRSQGNFDEADRMYARAIELDEKLLGPHDPSLASVLNNRAELLAQQGMISDAAPLFKRALEILEKSLGQDHPSFIRVLGNQAALLEDQGESSEAESLFQRCLTIEEKVLGPDHPDVAETLNNWASLLHKQGRNDEAAELYERSLAIWEKALGPDHPKVAQSLANKSMMFYDQGKMTEAGRLLQRSQAILEKAPDHPALAETLENRAVYFDNEGKLDEAGQLYARATEIWEKVLGPDHPKVVKALENRAELLQDQGEYAEADRLYVRAIEIEERKLGPDHPDLVTSLDKRAGVLEAQGNYDEAGQLYGRSLAIREKALGPDHPDVADSLNKRAVLLAEHGDVFEAWRLFERAVSIHMKNLGGSHPTTIRTQDNFDKLRAAVLKKHPLFERALSIHMKNLGGGDPETVNIKDNFEALRAALQEAVANENASRSIRAAPVAGAVVGGLVAGGAAGVVAGGAGAMAGAVAFRAASKREDGIGKVARGAGAAADVVIKEAKALERDLEMSSKAKAAAEKAKQAAQKFDSKFSVSQRAKEAARKTVGAERAAGAAKTAEKTLNQAGSAFSSFRSRVKKSLDK